MTNSHSNNTLLSFLLWNANGLQNHYHDLHICLNSRNIDIALITETYLTPNKTLFFPNYSTIRTDHPDGIAGAAIFIRNNIKYSFSPLTANQSIQSANIQLNINNTNTTIVAAYFPPANPVNEIILKDFFSSLNKNYVINGDFSSKHP
jgi:exonuclease III